MKSIAKRQKILKVCLVGLLFNEHLRNKRHSRRWAVHPINKKRNIKGENVILVKELEKYPGRYYQYFRMEKDRFDFILQKIFKIINGHVVTPREKLVITLK